MGVFRLLRRLGVLLVAATAACAAAPIAEPPAVAIAPGVVVGDIPVGGLTSEPARRKLRGAFERPLRFTLEGERWQVAPARLGAASVDDAVTSALFARARARIPLRVSVERSAVRAYVARLSRRLYVPPRNAELVGVVDLRPAFSEPKPGRRVVRKPLVDAIVWALRTGDRRVIPVPVEPVAPDVTPESFGPVVVIRRQARRLTLYDGPDPVAQFPVGVGQRQYPTPLGHFSIVDMQRNPWWRPPDSDWARGKKPIPPGPGNPLGTRWMGLSVPAVGIHGTPDAASVGYSVSHGCIRMRIPDAERLFSSVRIGTPVLIIAA